jgi:glycosyltransferase involved in cell wall biosynthesis
MRILLYNFVPPEQAAERQGGGVAIYQANLTQALRQAGHDVVTLGSGDRYSIFGNKPFLQVADDHATTAYIVNSPVFAPAHSTFYNIRSYTEDSGLDALPMQLRTRFGRFDVVHLQNLEGLTVGFLRAMRAAFPETRILLSAHNYNLVCPQVNLWFREHRACTDYLDGRACVNCLLTPDLHRHQRNARRMETVLSRIGITRHSPLLKPVRWLLRTPFRLRRRLLARRGTAEPNSIAPLVLIDPQKAAEYAHYRQVNIALCEDVFDRVLAVSARTRDVLAHHGVPSARLAVSYIGTAQAARCRTARRITSAEPGLHLGYLGYMRQDKGFYFLLEALETLPVSLAGRLSVTIAARIWDQGAVHRLRSIAHRFRAITLYDGYTHATLDQVLEGVNLGIVPPLWEDNLPQVAIEMAARGIPLLTSDRGGAQEIAGQPDFSFTAGSAHAFHRRLHDIATGRLPLARFWDRPARLLSMEEHLVDLMTHYAPEQPAFASAGQ